MICYLKVLPKYEAPWKYFTSYNKLTSKYGKSVLSLSNFCTPGPTSKLLH